MGCNGRCLPTFLQHTQILDFVSEVCHGVMKVCTSDDVIDETLGDESSAGGEL